jgi:anaerobic magnesium-protoporphyrin IX monomethyl ester cyclase
VNIAFVYPAIAGWGFNCYRANIETSWVSHGLAVLSACAKARGHSVSLLDLRRLKGWDEFGQRIEEQNPDLVGVYISSVDYNPAMKAIEQTRHRIPHARIAVGGPHPSLAVKEFLENPHIDTIFIGEGEISFPAFLEEMSQGRNGKDRVIEGEKPDLDAIPFIDRTLFGPYEMSPSPRHLPEPFMSTIAGRGCLFQCKFCQPAEAKIFGKKVRRRSVENVIEELGMLRRDFGLKSFIIHDDCLTEDKRWIRAFCEAVRREAWDLEFMCQSRTDLICRNPDLVKEMAAVGLKILIIGFESGSQRVLDFLGKGTTVEQSYRAAEICREYGVGIWGNYMLGNPTETKDEVMETVRMMRRIKPDIYGPSFFTPHVGSEMYDYCVEEGLWSPSSHDEFRRNAPAPKITGVDYEFLYRALELSKNRPPIERFVKWLVRKTLGTRNLMTTYQFLGKIARRMGLKKD